MKPEGLGVYYANELQLTTKPLAQVCEIDENTIGGIDYSFEISDIGWTSGDFVLRGTSFNATFNAEFLSEPKTGIY